MITEVERSDNVTEETNTSGSPAPEAFENEKEKADKQLDAPAGRTRGIKQRR